MDGTCPGQEGHASRRVHATFAPSAGQIVPISATQLLKTVGFGHGLQYVNAQALARAQREGNATHSDVADAIQGLSAGGAPSEEVRAAASFLKTQFIDEGFTIVACEWMLAAEESGAPILAGTIDLLLRGPTGEHVLVDWKRTLSFGRKPIGQYDLVERDAYSMQLSLYAYILERHYDIQVTRGFVVGLKDGMAGAAHAPISLSTPSGIHSFYACALAASLARSVESHV